MENESEREGFAAWRGGRHGRGEAPLVEPWWQEELAYLAAGFVTNLVLGTMFRGLRATRRHPIASSLGVLAVVGGALGAWLARRERATFEP